MNQFGEIVHKTGPNARTICRRRYEELRAEDPRSRISTMDDLVNCRGYQIDCLGLKR